MNRNRWRTGRALGLSVLLGTALGFGASCSEDGTAGTGPCAEELEGRCGGACEAESEVVDCGQQLHCGPDGKCTAECVIGDDRCGEGMTCNARGRCVQSGGSDGGLMDGAFGDGGLGEGGGGNADACIDLDVDFEPQVPSVVLLIDQSGSMNQTFDGGERWNVLRDALMDDQDGIVARLQDRVRFGLALYTGPQGEFPPGQNSGDRSEPSGDPCPVLTEVPIALNNHADILASYEPDDWRDETPTGESLELVAATLADFSEPGPKVIVLATDGEPDTCAQPNPQEGQGVAIAAVQAAYEQDITTFVISVGNDVGETHLRHVANAGQGFDIDEPGDRFYRANSQAELESAFDSIINGVRSCVFELDGSVEEGQESEGEVVLDGEELVYEDPDGWRLNSDSELELLGDACDAIKTGDHELDISFPCGTFVPIPK